MSDPFAPTEPTTPTTESNPLTAPAIDPFATQLAMIKGNGDEPKYKDTPTALNALAASQDHIGNITAASTAKDAEIAQLREELTKRRTVEDFVEGLATAQPLTAPETPAPNQGLTAEQVAALVDQRTAEVASAATAEANQSAVAKQLTELYGDKASTVVATRAAELNTTVEGLLKMSRENPSMALSLFAGTKAPTAVNPIRSSTNSTLNPQVANDLPQVPEGVSFIQGGATSDEIKTSWADLKKYTYKELGIES